jgi:hypothetical protein
VKAPEFFFRRRISPFKNGIIRLEAGAFKFLRNRLFMTSMQLPRKRDNACDGCDSPLNLMNIEQERLHGFGSYLSIRCATCNLLNTVVTNKTHPPFQGLRPSGLHLSGLPLSHQHSYPTLSSALNIFFDGVFLLLKTAVKSNEH